jgi:hypothetical protein
MQIEFAGRAPQDRKIRRGHATAAVLVLLGAALISGRRLPRPDFEVTPDVLRFVATEQSMETLPLNVTVRNPDAAPLRIASIAISGQMSDFHYTWNGCSDGVIQPKKQCTIGVTFRSNETSPQSALLQIVTAGSSIRSIRLNGVTKAEPPVPFWLTHYLRSLPPLGTERPDTRRNGEIKTNTKPRIDPQIVRAEISPDDLVDFKEVQIGSQAFTELKVSNTGTAALVINKADINGDRNDFFIGDDHCSGQTILPAGACSIQVQFMPGERGHHSAAIVVPSNAPQMSVSMGGTAILPPVPIADLEPGEVDLTRLDPDHTLTLANVGTGRLIANRIVLGGENPLDFKFDPRNCANTAIGNQPCSMPLVFLPDAAKRAKRKVSKATVTVWDNAEGSPRSINITGTESSTDHKNPRNSPFFQVLEIGLRSYLATRNTRKPEAPTPPVTVTSTSPVAKPPGGGTNATPTPTKPPGGGVETPAPPAKKPNN